MRTLVLHPDIYGRDQRRAPENALEEAVSLTEALDLEVVASFVVPVSKPVAGTLFRSGKVEELGALCAADDIGLVIFDGPLSPIQQRNLERAWKVKILDRTGLILEIFGDRAATREGVLQVELAHLNYAKSRLVRSWTHLERQRGGLGFVGGPGETQIEADRRAINEQILRIKKALTKVVKTRGLHRAARKKVPYPIVALVGYTNAGKSTLFNRLTGADVEAKDMLFATLDPTMRALELPEGAQVILSDTVGFISELPTQLVAAFRATLEEVLDADLVLHVRDIQHPETEAQAEDVRNILTDLGIGEDRQDKMLEVWNKTDLMSDDALASLQNLADRQDQNFAVSAVTGAGVPELLSAIETALTDTILHENLVLSYAQGRARAWLFEQNLVTSEEQTDEGFELDVSWTKLQKDRFEAFQST